MLTIGLTGGIGSGKSTAANIFKTLGIPVLDADMVAKQVMEHNTQLRAAIIQQFGAEAYIGQQLNRKYIGNIVFNDTYQLDVLNALVHPITIEAGLQWAAKQRAPYIIKEAALLFEAGSAANLHFIIGVKTPKHIRIQRVMKRDGITRDAVLARMDKQIDESIKMRLCDFIIDNSDQQLLIPQVLQLHARFLEYR